MEQSHEQCRSEPGTDLAAQLIHAEAIVESLQAQLWSGCFDPEMFAAGVESACRARSHGVPDLATLSTGGQLFERALALGQRWQQVPPYGTLELEMEGC